MSSKRRMTGVALILLGLGLAVSAILGPLGLGIISFRVSPSAQIQLLGGEFVSLVVAAPVAIPAGVLWLQGHRLAPALAIGPAMYAVYTYVQFILGPDYRSYPGNNESLFPLYVLLTILSWTLATRAWLALDLLRPTSLAR
jgi:hypothetical protein